MKAKDIEGIIPAMLTPMTENGELDFAGIRENVEFLITNGIKHISCLGSTGEVAGLTRQECVKVIEATVEAANGRVPIMVGTGAPSTREVIERTREAKSAGADSVLIITPYYEIPTQQGLYKHYATVAEAVDIDICLYNIPAHTNVEIELQTLERLAEFDNIVAMKDSSSNLSYCAKAVQLVGNKMAILCGSDDISLPAFVIGCRGAIFALANIAPRLLVDLFTAVKANEIEKAKRIYYQLLPIARAIGSAENFPAPIKEAVNMLGRPAGPTRSPIMNLSREESKAIRASLEKACLI